MIKTEKLKVGTCDGCGTRVIHHHDDDEDPWGYSGRTTHIGSFGGNVADWFACSKECITDAVVNALDKAR